MRNPETKPETPKFTLDLKEWKRIENAEDVMKKNEKGKYYIISNKWVTTIIIKEGGKPEINHYEFDDIGFIGEEDLLDTKKITLPVEEQAGSELLQDLLLSPSDEIDYAQQALYRAKYDGQMISWLKPKGKGGNKIDTIIVLDYTGVDLTKKNPIPKRTVYPLNKYNLKKETVKI